MYELEGTLLANGDVTFRAAAEATPTVLSANTEYFILFEDLNTGGDSSYEVRAAADAADDVAAAGWSLDHRYAKQGSGDWSSAGDVNVLALELKGTVVPLATDASLSDLGWKLTGTQPTTSSFNETFSSTTYAYSLNVAGSVAEVTLAPTLNDSTASFKYLNASNADLTDADSMEAGFQVALEVGDNIFKVRVTAQDGVTTQDYTLTITRAEANAEPTFNAGQATSLSVAENTAASTNIGSPFRATDGNSDPITWSLSGTDAGSFSITSGGQIQTVDVFNFESGVTSYSVTVNISDQKDAAGNPDTAIDASHNVTISVTDVEEAGVVTVTGVTRAGGTLTASLSDDDGDVSGVSWFWWRSATATGTFTAVVGATSSTYTTVDADVGMYLSAQATYTDRRGSGKLANSARTSQILAANSNPEFSVTTATRDVDENTTTVVNLGDAIAATDDVPATLTYTLTDTDAGSGHADAFTVDNSGQIKTKADQSYDHEFISTYNVTLNVSDGEDRAGDTDTVIDDTVAVTITINNIEEPGTLTVTGMPIGGQSLFRTLRDDDAKFYDSVTGTFSYIGFPGGIPKFWVWVGTDPTDPSTFAIYGSAKGDRSYLLDVFTVNKHVYFVATYNDNHVTDVDGTPGDDGDTATSEIIGPIEPATPTRSLWTTPRTATWTRTPPPACR